MRGNYPARGDAIKVNYAIASDTLAICVARSHPRSRPGLRLRPHRQECRLVIRLVVDVDPFHVLLGADCAVGVDIKIRLGQCRSVHPLESCNRLSLSEEG